jgi:acyl-CoA dehydrogenase
VQVAKAYTRGAQPSAGLFPSEHIPTRLAAVRERYAHFLNAPAESVTA